MSLAWLVCFSPASRNQNAYELSSPGFGYHFDSLYSFDNTNELAHAFSVIFSTARKFRLVTILQVWFPILRRFVSRDLIYATNPVMFL